MDWVGTAFARKRPGSTALSLSGGTAPSNSIKALFRHVPGNDETAAELFLIDGAATPVMKRLAGGTSWANVTLVNNIPLATAHLVSAASLNGKLFLAYDTVFDRLHCWDGTSVRMVGSIDNGGPTIADTGSGSYAATLRYYRVFFARMNGSITVSRSEASTGVSFTPSGSGTHARLTKPSTPADAPTHWFIEISPDNVNWYSLTSVVVGTTTYDDNTNVSTFYNTAQVATYEAGLYKPPPSAKYLLSDGNRLLMAGAWEASGATSGGKNSRVWFTPVLGDADKGDDERVPNTTTRKNWVDLNENDGGAITALAGPINGIVYVGKYRQLWKLIPTGDVLAPYQPRKITDSVGILSHRATCVGEDEHGRPCVYFMSHKGPYRLGAEGLQYIGRDNEDLWRQMNLGATLVCHALWYADLHQVWFYWSIAADSPNAKMMFDVSQGRVDELGQVRGGWAQHLGAQGAALCSAMFSDTVGATMSRNLKPYIGKADSAAVWKCYSSATMDDGNPYQSYVMTRPIRVSGDLRRFVGLGEPHVLAQAGTATVSITMRKDFGLESRTGSTTITGGVGFETHVIKKIGGLEWDHARVIQLVVGDESAVDNSWVLDGVVVPVRSQDNA